VIYVGADFSVPQSGGKGFDDFRTPYTRWAPHPKSSGVEVNATTYLNLVRGDWLRRPSPVVELGVLLLTGIVAGGLLTRLRPLAAVGAGTLSALAVAVVGCLMPRLFHVWFPWMLVVAVQLPVAIICSALFGLQGIHESWRALEASLTTVSSKPVLATPSPNAPELVTSEVLQQMQRLRGSSGMSPGVTPALALASVGSVPAVPDHQLLQCVGRGAYGEVWLALNVMGRYRAAKIIYQKNFKEPRPYEREFEGIRRFEPISRNHPGLVQILHVGRDDAAGYYYYLMEAADDGERGQEIVPDSYSPKTLAKVIHQHRQLAVAECLRLAESLTLALDYLHRQGLIHRDIKPSNIIFVNGEPKLADIGLVTSIGKDRSFVGTAGYFPPEGPGTPAADLYSLGKVLYELTTGLELTRFPELPTSFNEREHARELSELNNVILKACEVNPRRRYQSAREMHLDLERVLRRKPGWFGRARR
jgi:tRNA A-37 threonylcarbamoyl transferase component Bud32